MKQYNKLFKWSKYNECTDNNDDDCSDSDDTNNNNNENTYILDNVIRHPYMEQLDLNLDLELDNSKNNVERNYLINYRINTYNMVNHLVEFYILDDFLSSSIKNNLLDSKDESCLTTDIQSIDGEKRIKGSILFKSNCYTFVQIRNNKDTSNWLNIWDILVNKHYFGKAINEHVIDFFKSHNELSNLMLKQTICLKPIVLYNCIEERFHEYIKKTKNIHYCQNKMDPFIKLHQFKETDNIRTVCFVDDVEFSKTTSDLSYKPCIIMNNNREEQYNQDQLEWIFKTDSILFSTVK